MNKKTKTKWFFLGLISGWLSLVIVGFISVNIMLQHDPYNGVKPDIGEPIVTGPTMYFQSTEMKLGNTEFMVMAGPYRNNEDSDDWEYYSIEVVKEEGHLLRTYFKRDIWADQIPTNLITAETKDITTFNEDTHVVKFCLGTTNFTYTLPDR